MERTYSDNYPNIFFYSLLLLLVHLLLVLLLCRSIKACFSPTAVHDQLSFQLLRDQPGDLPHAGFPFLAIFASLWYSILEMWSFQ